MLLTAGAAGLLSACGFQLRRAPELRFKTIYLSGFKPYSPLLEELRRQISMTTTTRVVDAPTQAEVVLDALTDKRDKSIVAQTTAGQVRELQLRLTLQFRLRTAGGKELISHTELALTRDMTYNERDALGKEQEEEFLYRAMQSDISLQVLRRLAAVQTL